MVYFCLGSPVLLRGGNVTSQSRCTSRVRTTRGHGCLASDGSKWFRFDLSDRIGNEMPKEAFKPPLQGILWPALGLDVLVPVSGSGNRYVTFGNLPKGCTHRKRAVPAQFFFFFMVGLPPSCCCWRLFSCYVLHAAEGRPMSLKNRSERSWHFIVN